jgi:hypothetical protein
LLRHEDTVTEEFFIELTKSIASRLRLSAGDAVIDGTVIAAAGSHLKALKIDALKHAAERANEQAAARPDDSEAARKAAQLEQAVNVCEERNAKREAKNRLGSGAQVVPDEPEAVVQTQKDGSVRPSYKPSVIAHESGLVCGFHVDPSSETAAVEPLIEQHRQVLGEAPQRTMLDAGYFTAFVLAFFFDRDLDVLCPSGRARDDESMKRSRRNPNGQFLKSEFRYDEQQDAYVCPADRLLKRAHRSNDANGHFQKYRGTACADCPLKAQCTRSAARTLKRYDSDELKDAMTDVMRQPGAKKAFRRRSCGERPFAGIKTRQALTRFHRRGLRGARLETALHFAAWNLRLATGALAVVSMELWQRTSNGDASWRPIVSVIIVAWSP